MSRKHDHDDFESFSYEDFHEWKANYKINVAKNSMGAALLGVLWSIAGGLAVFYLPTTFIDFEMFNLKVGLGCFVLALFFFLSSRSNSNPHF